MTHQLLLADREGSEEAATELIGVVYEELRGLATSWFQRQPANHTLQPTAVVHEAYLRLLGAQGAWQDRCHFLAVASTAMRQVLVDHARAKNTQRRGSEWQKVTMSEVAGRAEGSDIDILVLDEALTRLAELNERQAKIAELRFIGGLSVDDVANVIDVSPRTVELDTRTARAWLRRELGEVG